MLPKPAFLILFAAAQVPPESQVVVTGSALAGCGERVYHPPGPVERLEGVLYSWIDNSGFVPCSETAECKRFLELESLDFRATDEASEQISAHRHRLGQFYGRFRIRFEGRRGAMTLPNCIDHSLPDRPEYVQIEKVLSMEQLED